MSTRHRPLPFVLVVLGALLFATTAQANLIDTRVSAAKAQKRTCHAGLASGKGVVRRSVTATESGLVSARLTRAGKRRGDWDLAVFSRRDGRLVAASAYRGTRELAQGVVADGERLQIQACRRSGRARGARLSAESIAIEKTSGEKIRLVRIETPTDASQQRLEALGLDLTEHAREGFREALLYSAADDRKLQKAGLAYTVRIADVIAADRRALTRSKSASAAGPQDSGEGVPSGRTDYRRLADYSAEMKAMADANPQFARTITLPFRTLEGRPVEGIEISQDIANSDHKPVFLQMGVHHAREWPSGEHAMEWAVEMVNGLRDGDARVTELLSKSKVIVVPIVNPDGFNLSREASFDIPVGPVGLLLESFEVVEGFAYKRRNCRVQDGTAPAPGQCGEQENRFLGVDPNRNYGGFWGGPGASSAPDNDTYRGAAPFSEPETQNVKALVSRNQVTTLITNHTYSDLVLRPPGLAAEGDPPDEPVYKALGDSMAAENGYSSEKSWELYDTTGTTEDWSYYATGGLGFTFEIGKAADGPTGYESFAGAGFHPPYPIGVIAEWHGKYPQGGGNEEAYYTALESTANPERHSVITGEAPEGSKLTLRKEFSSYTSPVIQPNGTITAPLSFPDVLTSSIEVGGSRSFEWHVNPSTRPFAKESRSLGIPSDTPAESRSIESASILPPVQTFPIEVRPDGPRSQIAAWIDGADGDDWDIYLYKGDVPVPETDVARSAGESADESLSYMDPEPGRYTLEVRYFTAENGWTGGIDLYGLKDTVELPAHEETWTLTCERRGRVVEEQQVSVERGQSVDVSNACGRGSVPAGGGSDGDAPLGGPGVPSANQVARVLGRVARWNVGRRAVTFRQRFLATGSATWTLRTLATGAKAARSRRLGSARRTIASTGVKKVRVALNRRGRRLVRRGSARRVVLTTRLTSGGQRVSTRTVRRLR
jgi:hypothetical protein